MNKTQRGGRKASRRKASRCGGKKTHHRTRKGGQTQAQTNADDTSFQNLIKNMTRGGLGIR